MSTNLDKIISEAKILEVKQTEIHEKASQSIKSKGWLPNLFRGIVARAKDFLQPYSRKRYAAQAYA